MTWSTCALCPRLCRSSCPVALGSGREASVPSMIAGVLLQVERGECAADLAREALTLCTDCGACQEHCHLDVPLPEALRNARNEVLPPPSMEPLPPLNGTGTWVAIESDERSWGPDLARALGEPVRVWKTRDALGVAAIHHPMFSARASRIRDRMAGLRPVVSDGGVSAVLEAAGVEHQWLRELVPTLPGGCGSCRLAGPKPSACCGGAGPLTEHHPADADRMGRFWLERLEDWVVQDSRCRQHLSRCSEGVRDSVDALIAGDFSR